MTAPQGVDHVFLKKRIEAMNKFEPNISNFDDSIVQSIGNSDEEYSGFQLFGIGKPTQKQLERREGRKEKRKDAKEERKEKGFLKGAWNITAKFNPAAALVRAGTLAGMRLNIFGLSRKLYPALLTEEELKSRNFDLENAKNAKKALERVHKFYFGLGGRSLSIDKAIKQGYDKPVFNTKKLKSMKAQEKSSFTSYAPDEMNTQIWTVYPAAERPYFYSRQQGQGKGIEFTSGFDCKDLDLPFSGEEDYFENATGAEETALITAGLGALTAIAGLVTKLVKNNPYKQGSTEYSQAETDISQATTQGSLVTPPVNQEQVNKMMEQAKGDVEQGGDPMEEGGDDKILGIPKTGFYVGLGLISAAAIGLLIWKMKKK